MPTTYPPFCELLTKSKKKNNQKTNNIFGNITISESIFTYFKSFFSK